MVEIGFKWFYKNYQKDYRERRHMINDWERTPQMWEISIEKVAYQLLRKNMIKFTVVSVDPLSEAA